MTTVTNSPSFQTDNFGANEILEGRQALYDIYGNDRENLMQRIDEVFYQNFTVSSFNSDSNDKLGNEYRKGLYDSAMLFADNSEWDQTSIIQKYLLHKISSYSTKEDYIENGPKFPEASNKLVRVFEKIRAGRFLSAEEKTLKAEQKKQVQTTSESNNTQNDAVDELNIETPSFPEETTVEIEATVIDTITNTPVKDQDPIVEENTTVEEETLNTITNTPADDQDQPIIEENPSPEITETTDTEIQPETDIEDQDQPVIEENPSPEITETTDIEIQPETDIEEDHDPIIEDQSPDAQPQPKKWPLPLRFVAAIFGGIASFIGKVIGWPFRMIKNLFSKGE